MTLFLFALLIVGAALAFIYYDSHRSAAAKLHEQDNREDDQPLDIETEIRRIQACIQAGIVGDKFVPGAIASGSYTGPLPERRADGGWLSIYDNLRILKIAGINHRQGISRYIGRINCVLVPEPDNEYDPDAIKIVAEDRHHLGYIPSGQTDLVCSFSANEFPYRCTAFIDEHENEDNGHKFFTGFVYIKRLD